MATKLLKVELRYLEEMEELMFSYHLKTESILIISQII